MNTKQHRTDVSLNGTGSKFGQVKFEYLSFNLVRLIASERENRIMNYDSEHRKMWTNKNKEVSLSNHIVNPK